MNRRIMTHLGSKTFQSNKIEKGPISVNQLRDGETVHRYYNGQLIQYTRHAGRLFRLLYIDVKFNEDINDNIETLTDSTGGTASDTLAAISGSGADSDINNNFADLSSKLNEKIQVRL